MGWGVLLLSSSSSSWGKVVREGQDFGGYGVWDLICNLSFFLRQKKKAVFIYESFCVFYLVVSSRGAFLQKLLPSLGVAAYLLAHLLAFSFFLSFFLSFWCELFGGRETAVFSIKYYGVVIQLPFLSPQLLIWLPHVKLSARPLLFSQSVRFWVRNRVGFKGSCCCCILCSFNWMELFSLSCEWSAFGATQPANKQLL